MEGIKIMKKLIFIMLVSMTFIGCHPSTHAPKVKDTLLIREIEESSMDGYGCLYLAATNVHAGYYIEFYDECGKFTVGDTLKLVK